MSEETTYPTNRQVVLDTTVPSAAELDIQDRRSDDPEEGLRVYADRAGHPFCILRRVGLLAPVAW